MKASLRVSHVSLQGEKQMRERGREIMLVAIHGGH